jgi:DNA-binding XRE family transcriptional regulator
MTDQIENAAAILAERLANAKSPFLGALLAAKAVPAKWIEWPFHKAFGLFRRSRGLTQADVAARASVSRCQIIQLERGGDIQLSTLRRIFAALDCDLVLLPRSDTLIAKIENEQRQADKETALYWKECGYTSDP